MFSLIFMVLGLIIGSFLNVCICRIPKGENISYPASHCTVCNHRLQFWDLIPLLSYISLKGKCRYCKTQISIQYLIIELLNGIGYSYAVYYFGFTIQAFLSCLFISTALVLTTIDLQYMLLPTSIILVGSLGALLLRGLQAYFLQDISYITQGLLGALVGYVLFGGVFAISLRVFKKEGLGYGDVRYLGMIGLYTSPLLVCFTLALASIIGSIWGGILYIKAKRSEVFPLGPSISIAAFIAIFWGDKLIQWYISLFL